MIYRIDLPKIPIELLLPIYITTNFPTFKYSRYYKQTYSSLLKSIHRLELESTCNAIVRQFRICTFYTHALAHPPLVKLCQ